MTFKSKKIISIIILLSLFLVPIISAQISIVSARSENVGGNKYSGKYNGGEGWVSYNFSRNNNFQFNSNISMNIEISLNSQMSNKDMKFNISNDNPLNINITANLFSNRFNNSDFKQGRYQYRNNWGSYLQIQTNSSVESMEISAIIGTGEQVSATDQFFMLDSAGNWLPLTTTQDGDTITTTLTDTPTNFYVSIFTPTPDYTTTIVIVVIIGIIGLSVTIMLSKSEYREFLKNRLVTEHQTRHRLTIEEVLENENRSKIIDLILDHPGIHFNEILRQTGLSPGNLVWHLDVLETFKVIGKKNVGQYLIYFPYHDSNPMSNIDIKLAKSKVTLEILNIIEENPGNYANQIAKKLNLDHKTIKYHLDKLLESDLIRYEKKGRKNLLYPKVGNIREINIDRNMFLENDED